MFTNIHSSAVYSSQPNWMNKYHTGVLENMTCISTWGWKVFKPHDGTRFESLTPSSAVAVQQRDDAPKDCNCFALLYQVWALRIKILFPKNCTYMLASETTSSIMLPHLPPGSRRILLWTTQINQSYSRSEQKDVGCKAHIEMCLVRSEMQMFCVNTKTPCLARSRAALQSKATQTT